MSELFQNVFDGHLDGRLDWPMISNTSALKPVREKAVPLFVFFIIGKVFRMERFVKRRFRKKVFFFFYFKTDW